GGTRCAAGRARLAALREGSPRGPRPDPPVSPRVPSLSPGAPPVSRLSIVTPSYNQAEFVGETIESVLGQEGDFELEYFVMDGGATEGSVEVIRRYAELVEGGRWTPRCRRLVMRWASAPDDGQAAAINAGLRQATGDVLAYINSDDLYFPGAFARVLRAFAA